MKQQLDQMTPAEIAADRCPPDVQEYGRRNGLPGFAKATWEAGFIDGYRLALKHLAKQSRLTPLSDTP